MKTYRQGYIKKHANCGGIVRYIESLDPTHYEWDAECLKCLEVGICEENIEFETKAIDPKTIEECHNISCQDCKNYTHNQKSVDCLKRKKLLAKVDA